MTKSRENKDVGWARHGESRRRKDSIQDAKDQIEDVVDWTEADEIGAVTAYETPVVSLSCPHGRPSWQMCPHCLGLTFGPLSSITAISFHPMPSDSDPE